MANLAVSTLRGQFADNRDWTRDPSRPAIIIGTVDMIGSRLLFSGYRSSYKQRPLDAGLLGQDSLLVLDEAHLSKPFEKLICAIGEGGSFQKNREDNKPDKPMRVIRMSATSERSNCEKQPFTLQIDDNGNLTDDDAKDTITAARFDAKKCLTITTLGEKDSLNSRLAGAAIELAENSDVCGKRIVVFVRSPEDARVIAATIRNHAKPTKSKSNSDPKGPYAGSVELLTGTMRGLERDELVKMDVFEKRLLNGELDPSELANQQPVFLVSTSAGEVGFDLNADHLVGDESPLDSWIQRLGRVNRRGTGDATVILIKEEKDAKNDFDKACIVTSKLFTDGMDVSPKALAAYKKTLTAEEIKAASTPEPAMVELTDILLDAWSMTSIIERMPGRPEVAPWLRGIAPDMPQTTIAWRAELDEPGFADMDATDIEEWFDTHRILTHETLSVPTSVAAKWFIDRWTTSQARQGQLAERPVIVDRAGMTLTTVKNLIDQLSRKGSDNVSMIRNADLILPASFGGIERGIGLLDAAAPKIPEDDKDTDKQTRVDNARKRLAAPDVADMAPWQPRLREVIATTEDGETEKKIIGNGTMPARAVSFRIDLESDDDRRTRLVSHVPRREKTEFGSQRQTLRKHVDAVRRSVDGILKNMGLPDNVRADITLGAQFAAAWHDHGKNRERWQRTVCGEATPPGQDWLDATLGKSGGKMKRDSRGYRHEFGSLREFTDAFNAGSLLDEAGNPISQHVFDLALHMIATHHGRGRPHFPKGGFDPECESRSAQFHAESIRRFARLQRKYGWWHLAWLENLLRCADALASGGDV